MHPVKDSTNAEQVLNNARIDQDVHRFSPEELYSEATSVLLDPTARTTATVIDAAQADQALPGDLDLSGEPQPARRSKWTTREIRRSSSRQPRGTDSRSVCIGHRS
jgi:hypothetical protein